MNHAITRAQLADSIKSILIDTVPELKSARDTINLDTHLTQNLALDSLAWAEFLMAIEDNFQVQISEEEAQAIETLGALVDCIANKSKI